MRVRVGSLLHRYTDGVSYLEAEGATLRDVLEDLESRHVGMRFRVIDEQDRIRRHICIFVGEDMAADLEHPVRDADMVHILGALSGG